MKAISVQEIRQIITELDPIGSIGFPNFAPYSEYFVEADQVAEWLVLEGGVVTVDALSDAIWKIFCESFGRIFPKEEFVICAGQILGVDNRVKCPVCKKHYFQNYDDYQICPICHWENDGLQSSYYNYSFGANDLSVNEATVRYTIHLNVEAKQLELDYWNQYSAASDVIWAELEQFPDQSVTECDSYYDKIDELRGTYIKHILALYIRYFVDEEMETSDDLLEQYAYKIKNYTMKALYEGVPGYYDRTPTLYEDDSDGDDDDK